MAEAFKVLFDGVVAIQQREQRRHTPPLRRINGRTQFNRAGEIIGGGLSRCDFSLVGFGPGSFDAEQTPADPWQVVIGLLADGPIKLCLGGLVLSRRGQQLGSGDQIVGLGDAVGKAFDLATQAGAFVAFVHRDFHLPQTGRQSHPQTDHNQSGTQHDGAVAADEFPRAINQSRGAGGDRLMIQVSADVVGQRGGGVIATVAVLLDRFHDDAIQVAVQHRSKFG